VFEPKAKKKYKTKKEKDTTMEELLMIAHTMVGEELHDEEAQNLKELVEETTQPTPQKSKKKKTRNDEMGPSKAKAHERTPYPIKQRKGVDEVNVSSSAKTPTTPKKHKGKEKVLKPIVESNEHINFHSFELNGDVNSLIAPLDGPKKEKGGKQAVERLVVDQSPKKQEEETPKVEKSSKEFLAFMDFFMCLCSNKRKP
jgi:hypothetical protein